MRLKQQMQKLEQESGIDPLLLGFEASVVRFSKKGDLRETKHRPVASLEWKPN
jgi:hypothetical protein